MIQLILQYMANENLSRENLKEIAERKNIELDCDAIFDVSSYFSFEDAQRLAQCLDIEATDIMLPEYKDEEVVVKSHTGEEGLVFPNKDTPLYKIWPLAKTSKMSLMRGTNIEVVSKEANLEFAFNASLHSYNYNYGESPILFTWVDSGEILSEEIQPGDSIYIQPFIKHTFTNTNLSKTNGKILSVRVSGAVNLSTQKELSNFADIDRIIETKSWFD